MHHVAASVRNGAEWLASGSQTHSGMQAVHGAGCAVKAKVREHMKFATLAARAKTDLSEPEPVCVEPSGTTESQPLQRELQSLGLGACMAMPMGVGVKMRMSTDGRHQATSAGRARRKSAL
jgi:hypothetical protein